jgi:hypothetical protein
MLKKRLVSLTLAAALVLTMFAGVSAIPVNAASGKYELPVKVITYYNEATENLGSLENAVWKKQGTETYKYNKLGYCTECRKIKTKWTLKGSKRVKAKTGSKKSCGVSRSTYRKGKLKSVSFKIYSPKGKLLGRVSEKYKTTKSSKGWITRLTGNKAGTKYTVTYKYKFHSNGMPKTIKETEKAYGKKYTKTYSFNSNGLITRVKSKDETVTFQYKYENGRVSERIVSTDGMIFCKDVFVYDGVSTKDKKTFLGIMSISNLTECTAVRDALPQDFPWLAK